MTASGGIQQQLSRQTSPLKKYRQTMVGDKGLLFFVLYEFYLVCASWLPGRLGESIRAVILPFFITGKPSGLKIGANVTLRRPEQITIGNNVSIGAGVTLDMKSERGELVIGDNVSIGEGTILSCPGGTLSIGRSSTIGHKCRLGSLLGLSIGRACDIGDQVCIVGAGHCHDRLDMAIINQPLTCRGPCIIGNNVSIQKNATVLDGIQIGDWASVAKESMVNKNVASGVKVAGIPASSCV